VTIKRGAVPRTFDQAVGAKFAIRQRKVLMRALIANRKQRSAMVADANAFTVGERVTHEPAGSQIVHTTYTLEPVATPC
jgi:hypothetical protein